jgi:hypothetical protein
MDYFTKWRRITSFPTKRHRLRQKHWLQSSSVASEYWKSCTATRAVTSSSATCRRICSVWEWTRHAPKPCARTREYMTVRYIETVEECLRKFVFSRQRDWDVISPSLLLAYSASAPANLGPWRELRMPYHLLLGTAHARIFPPSTTRWTLWTGCMRSTIMLAHIWIWPVTEWKHCTPAWSIARAIRGAKMGHCIAKNQMKTKPLKLEPA